MNIIFFQFPNGFSQAREDKNTQDEEASFQFPNGFSQYVRYVMKSW